MVKKLKGKTWFDIQALKMFNNKIIGITPAGDPKTLTKRKIMISALDLDNPNKYYLKLRFKLSECDENIVKTEFDGLECLADYISRMVRRGVNRIDTVQDLETKDNKKIRIKTMTLINKKAKKEIEVFIRKFIKEKIKTNVSSHSLDELIEKFLDDSIKKDIIEEGSKIYPIRFFEIRKAEMI